MKIRLSNKSNDEGNILLHLERRNRRLAKALCLIVGLWLFSCLGLYIFLAPRSTSAQDTKNQPITTDAVLRVRGLVIVDERGIERVWIGAPAVDPLTFGKRINRGDSGFSGILMFDQQGTERSGYGTDGSGTIFLTLDELGRQVATFAAQPIGGVSLTMNNRDDGKQKSLTMGTSAKGSYLKLSEQGKVIFQQPFEVKTEEKQP